MFHRLFISYRGLDSAKVDPIVSKLRNLEIDGRPVVAVWQDKYSIPPGKDWWQAIVEAIQTHGTFIFMISRESVKNINCLAEFRFAHLLNRPIIPLVLEGESKYNSSKGKYDIEYWDDIPQELKESRVQFLFYEGGTFIGQIYDAITEFEKDPERWAEITSPPPQDPRVEIAQENDPTLIYGKACDFAWRLELETAERNFLKLVNQNDLFWRNDAREWIQTIRAYKQLLDLDAQEATRYKLRDEWQKYCDNFPRRLPTRFDPRNLAAKCGGATLDTVKDEPASGEVSMLPEQSSDGESTQAGTTRVTTNSLFSRAILRLVKRNQILPIIILISIVSVALVIHSIRVSRGPGTSPPPPETNTSAAEIGLADLRTEPASVLPLPTDTPSNTSTPTDAPTPTDMPSATTTFTETPTHTPTNSSTNTAAATRSVIRASTAIDLPAQTLIATGGPLTFMVSSVTRNADWTRIEKDFNGVTMVLVPTGCFEMGDATDVAGGRQCFDEPFWIDRYEVSNNQFKDFGGEADSASDVNHPDRPRANINWFEASSFCQVKRGGFLPTEAAWEFAARGPDGLIYPWGDEWNPDNLVWSGNSIERAADIGSRDGGVSWVGAHDLSGNVWEWVSTMYDFPYPYATDDGREASNEDAASRHIMRGGSFDDNDPTVFSTVYRNPNQAERYWSSIGFRCARAFNSSDLN